MIPNGKLLERRYGLISDESKEELRNEEKLIALIVAGELLIFSGVVLGCYHPVAGSIFEIIGGLLNLCFFILLLVYAKKNKKK